MISSWPQNDVIMHKVYWKPILCGCQTFVLGKCPPGTRYCVLPLAYLCCILLWIVSINMHKIYGSICESKCESGFDCLTFAVTAVIVDRLWRFGQRPPCQYQISLAQPQNSCTLKGKKLANAWPAWALGNDILTSAIPLWQLINIHICTKWTKEVSNSLSLCFPVLVII